MLACHLPTSVGSGPAGIASSPSGAIPVEGLRDVACAATGCVALATEGLIRLPDRSPVLSAAAAAGFDTVRASGDTWSLEGPCQASRCATTLEGGALGAPAPTADIALPLEADPPSLADDALRFAAAWNIGAQAGWRSGFHRVIVGPGGGRLTWLRGVDGGGQLMRAGGGSRSARLGGATSPVSWPAWLALHPTGVEAYLVVWPGPVIRAFDPGTLEIRWTLAVEGAARGLFVDPGGRWLLLAVGTSETDRLLDWPILPPSAEPGADPNRDEVLRLLPAPPSDEVVVVDLATHTVAARARGSYRRFLPLDRPVLATDREVVFLTPGALP